MDADFGVGIFAIEVCEELRNGLKGLIGKKSFLAERERDSRTVEQSNRCVFQYIYLYFLYIIYYN